MMLTSSTACAAQKIRTVFRSIIYEFRSPRAKTYAPIFQAIRSSRVCPTSSSYLVAQASFLMRPSLRRRRHQLSARTFSSATAGGETNPELPEAESTDARSSRLFKWLTFGDVYYYINVAYWSLLLVSVITGNDLLSQITHFEYYTTAMFGASALFTAYHGVRFLLDAGRQVKRRADLRWNQFLRYSWNAVFWLGFVLWYAAPPLAGITEWTGTPGAIMCLFGLFLAGSAAVTEGLWSFMGEPQVPQRLTTTGPYAICRHPQALGNMLFLLGFSAAGGALAATAAFLVSFLLYHATVIPREEEMLLKAFPQSYEAYRQRTPSYAYALLLLVLLETVLIWRLYPYSSTPIGPSSA